MDQGLELQIGANVKDATTGIDSVRKKLADLYAQLDEGKARQALLIDPKNIRDAGKELNNITRQIDALEGNQGFANLGQSASKALGPLNDIYGGVRKLAQILPGIGIAGLFGAAFEGIAALVGPLLTTNTAVEKTTDIMAGAEKEFGKAAAQVFTLKENVQLAKDGFIDKTTVVKEYNDTLGQTLGKVTSLDEAEQKIAANADKYIRFTLLKAAAQVAYGKAADQAFQAALTAQKQADEFTNNFADARVSQQGTFNAADFDAETKRIKAAQEKRKQQAIQQAEDQKNKLLAIGNDFEKQAAEIAKNSNFNFDPDKSKARKATSAAPDTLAATQRALDEINRLNKEIGKVDARPIYERLADSLDSDKTDALSNKIALIIRNNARDGISKAITSKEVALVKKEIDKLQNPDVVSSVNTNVTIRSNIAEAIAKYYADSGKQLTDRIKTLPPLKTDIVVDPNFIFEASGETAKKYAERIKAITNEANQGIQNLIVGGLEAIGKSIAGAGNPFGAILELIGDAVEEFGKQLIVIAGIAVLAKEALATVFANPATAIAVGALAIIAGAAIKQLGQKKGVTAFSQGGVVTGPTMGLVGEAGPEAIIPLGKLDQILNQTSGNGGSIAITVNGRLSGNNLSLALARNNKLQSMV
jgi:hypothetical protein